MSRMLGLLFLGMGLVTLIIAGFHELAGETWVERNWGTREQEPERFGRLIRVSIVGSITCFAIAFYLLVWI